MYQRQKHRSVQRIACGIINYTGRYRLLYGSFDVWLCCGNICYILASEQGTYEGCNFLLDCY